MDRRTHLLATSGNFDSSYTNQVTVPRQHSYSTDTNPKFVPNDVSPNHLSANTDPADRELRGVSATSLSDGRVEDLSKFKVSSVRENSRLINNKDTGFSWYSSNSTTSRFSEGPINVEIPDNVSHSGMFDTATVKALEYCRKTVLQPYSFTLKLVGWKRIYSQSISLPCHQRFLNKAYPLLIVLVLILLYLTSVVTCRNGTEASRGISQFNLKASGNHSNNSITSPLHCQHLVSLFFIPYFLHLLAYLYALYSFRFNSSEFIDSLMEMTFVLSSRCQNVLVLHKNILFHLRFIMFICVMWQVFIFAEQIVYILVCINTEFSAVSGEKISLLYGILNIGSGVVLRIATGLVFIVLILHYTTQCVLIFSLARGIKQGLQEKSTSLLCAMRDMYLCKTYLSRLNKEAANSVSLCLISIIIYLSIDLKELVDILTGVKTGLSVLQIAHMAIDALLWIFALSVPLLMAAKLQGEFCRLKNLTYSIYLYNFKDSTQEQMNQFFLYATSITYKVRLFNITVRSSFLSFFFLTAFFVGILFLITTSSF